MKQKLARITDGVTFTKWKMELLNFDLNDLLINMRIQDWEKGLEEVFKKHFKEEIPKQKQTEEDQILDDEELGSK